MSAIDIGNAVAKRVQIPAIANKIKSVGASTVRRTRSDATALIFWHALRFTSTDKMVGIGLYLSPMLPTS